MGVKNDEEILGDAPASRGTLPPTPKGDASRGTLPPTPKGDA